MKPVREALATFGWTIWRCVPFTSSASFDDSSNESHVEALAGLFAFLVAQLGAGIFFEQKKGMRPFHILAYVLLGIVTLIAMCLIVGGVAKRRVGDGKQMYTSNQTTVQLGKWIIFWSLALCVSFAVLGFAGLLPGQRVYNLAASSAENFDEFVDKVPGIKVEVPIRPAHFGGEIPPTFNVLVQLSEKLKPDWDVRQAGCLEVKQGWGERAIQSPEVVGGTDPTQIIVQSLNPDSNYLLEVFLSPKRNSHDADVDPDAASDAKGTERVHREEAIQEILTRGGLELRWDN